MPLSDNSIAVVVVVVVVVVVAEVLVVVVVAVAATTAVMVMDLNVHRCTRLFSPDQPFRPHTVFSKVSTDGKSKGKFHPRTGHEGPERV